MKKLFVFSWLMILVNAASGARSDMLLENGWFCDGEAIAIPHTWNATDSADGSPVGDPPPERGMSIAASSYLHKIARYERVLPRPSPNRRQFLRFEGVSRRATVYINGKRAGEHVGAFTAFTIEATGYLNKEGENRLEVIADNLWDSDIAPLSADYSLMGGIYRPVHWIETPQRCIDLVTDGADGITLLPDCEYGSVIATIRMIDGEEIVRTYKIENHKLWTPEEPVLYPLRIAVGEGEEEDSVEMKFGFRKVEFREDGFYLNGVKRKLRGVNRHQDAGERGWAASTADERRDMELIKDIGADAVRLAHYPQSPNIFRLCDELGFLVWCEAPAINWLSPTKRFKENLLQQVREMVAQNRNRPSIFAWSIYNEIYNDIPDERISAREGWMEAILKELKEEMKRLDPERPVVAASDRRHRALLNALPDALAFNTYPLWYTGDTMEKVLDDWFTDSARPILAISEYGAGGNPFEHIDTFPREKAHPESRFHPEEVQVRLHSDDYRAIKRDARLWGSFVWAMFDFAADARREGASDGINDKGLITRDRRTLKDAFYFYKANWSAESVLHIAAARQTETQSAAIDVMGFSNAGEVELIHNGKSLGKRAPDDVCIVEWHNVALEKGKNTLTLIAIDGNKRQITSTRTILRR